MESLIAEILQKLQSLPEVKILEVLNFVEFLKYNGERLTLQQSEDNVIREDEEFGAIADQLADEFQMYGGSNIPALSDYAVSRAGIYEEHL
jgi:hypothetical protein